jgi:MFS family permease
LISFENAAKVLRRPDFLRLWIGLGLSQIGSQVSQVAVAWQLYLLTHSGFSLGLVGFFRFVPILIASFLGGSLADAVDRRRLMLVTQTTLALNSLAMAILTSFGVVQPAMIYAFVFIGGLCFAFDAPARHSLIPNLVPEDELPNAVSLNVTVFQVATVLGPSLGGPLLALAGPAASYAVDAASFVALIVALWTMRYRRDPSRATGSVSFAGVAEGLRFLRRTPVIFWLMLLDFFATFFAGSLLLMPFYADQLLHVGASGLGLLYAAPACGAVAAAVFLAGRAPIVRQGPTVLWSVIIYGASIAVFGLSRNFFLSFTMLALSGVADTVSMVLRQTVRQLLTPDELRGRMTALNQLFFVGGPQLGEFEAGVVARFFGAPASVISGGVLCVVAAFGMAAAFPSLRHLRQIRGESSRSLSGERPAVAS